MTILGNRNEYEAAVCSCRSRNDRPNGLRALKRFGAWTAGSSGGDVVGWSKAPKTGLPNVSGGTAVQRRRGLTNVNEGQQPSTDTQDVITARQAG